MVRRPANTDFVLRRVGVRCGFDLRRCMQAKQTPSSATLNSGVGGRNSNDTGSRQV